jgi:hypothetical protein
VSANLGTIGTSNIDTLVNLDLPAIPAINFPAPVTRSRSSR